MLRTRATLKQPVAGAFLLFFMSVTGWLVAQITEPDPLPIGAPMPALAFRGEAGPRVLRPDGQKPTIVVWFHSECKYCQSELDMLDAHAAELKDVRLYLFTPEDSLFTSRIRQRWPNLATAKATGWGVVSSARFREAFGVTATPANYLFDPEGGLTRKSVGETKPEFFVGKRSEG